MTLNSSAELKRAGIPLWQGVTVAAGVSAAAWRLGQITVSMVPNRAAGSDFWLQWLASRIGYDQSWRAVYDLQSFSLRVHALTGHLAVPYLNGPWVAVATWPLLMMPRELALLVWSLLLAAATVTLWALLAPNGRWQFRLGHLGALVASFGFGIAMYLAQPTLLAIALVAVAFRVRDRAWIAGILLGLALLLKPQSVFLLPLVLLTVGEWRTVAITAATVLIAIGATVAVTGLAILGEYLRALSIVQSIGLGAGDFDLLPPLLAYGVRAALVVLTVLLARRAGRPEYVYAAGIAGSLAAAPYLRNYEFVALVPALWLVLRAEVPTRLTWLGVALAYVLADGPLVARDVMMVPAALLVLALIAIRTREVPSGAVAVAG